MDAVAQLIREARKAQRLTQQEVAELSGVGLSTLHKIEAGRADVALRHFLAVADAVGVRLTARSPLGTEAHVHA